MTPSLTTLQGHCLDQMAKLPDGSVHCCVTSPPYWGLRDYKIPPVHWPAITFSPMPGLPPMTIPAQEAVHGLEPDLWAYIAHEVAVFRAVRRVLREDGVLWLNLGDSYSGGGRGGNPEESPFRKQATNVGSLVKASEIPKGLKPKDLCGIPWRVAFALQADGWWLRSDIIWHKCLSGGTRVYARTAKGEMPTTIKDLVRLDPATVKLWNGVKWTRAVSWSQTPRTGTEVELVLRSGERIGCTQNHVWPTVRGNIRTDALLIGDVIQTCHLPGPERPRNPIAIPDEIGWFVGIYIAEGSQSDGTIQIAGNLNESTRFDRLKKLAEAFDGYCFYAGTGGNSATVNINSPVLLGIIDAYVSGRTSRDKHLDVRCRKRSDAFLKSLLDGYLEGDGHNAGDRWRLCFCANDNLAADLRTLCARLGLSIRLKRAFHTCTNSSGGPKKFPGWRGEIRSQHRESGAEIVAIVKSRARKFWDISVEDAPHIFALASGVLTHNSNPMPESVTDRPTKAHEYIFLLTKSASYYYDAEAIKDKAQTDPHNSGYVNGSDYAVGPMNRNGHSQREDPDRVWATDGKRNKRTVWTVPSAAFSGDVSYGRCRIASPDCPVHDYQADRARALEYGEQLVASLSGRNPGNDAHPFQSQEGAFVAIPLGQCASLFDATSAICRSNETHKTAGGSKQGAIFFGISPDRIACIEPVRRLTAKFFRKHASKTLEDAFGDAQDSGPWEQSGDRIVGILDFGKMEHSCTCHYAGTVEKRQDHFACFPPDLIKPCILAGTSARGCCPKCGAPWERILERLEPRVKQDYNGKHSHADKSSAGRNILASVKAARANGGDHDNPFPQARTVDWQPSCECAAFPDQATTIPCTVLDPFLGSGTTAQVALELGRSAIGCEMNPSYLNLQEVRTNVTPGLPLA